MAMKAFPASGEGSGAHKPHLQLAALCWRKAGKAVEVLLVTSSNGRWILPKGWPIDGKSPAEAALVEAWEEGGVKKGRVSKKPLGEFDSVKCLDDGREEPCRIRVFEVKVEKVKGDYPEADRRDRRWVSPEAACEMVTDEGLKAILRRL